MTMPQSDRAAAAGAGAEGEALGDFSLFFLQGLFLVEAFASARNTIKRDTLKENFSCPRN